MEIVMSKRKITDLTELVIRAREEGAQWWEIKRDLGVPEGKAKAMVKERAPYVHQSSLRWKVAWEVGKLMRQGKTVPEMIAATGTSKNTVYAAMHIMECIEARREGKTPPGKPAWVS